MGLKILVTGYVTSLLLVTIGLSAVLLADKFLHSYISSSVSLDPSTDMYKQWLSPPIPVYMHLYLFNLKNGPAFQNGATPVFEEIGPFVYQEVITKENIVDNRNYTITYNERKTYYFLQDKSPYEENYPITTISIAALTIINAVRYKTTGIHTVINFALSQVNETLLVTHTAREMLFGYHDKFLSFIKKYDPKLVPDDMVGLFYGKNDTFDGEYTIFTGVDDYTKIGIIERFNRQNILNNWSDKYANQINGTDGTLSFPFITKSTVQYLFDSDLCRSIYANYNGTYITLDDIELYAFAVSEFSLANATVNPDNSGFCIPAGNCAGAGVLNLTTCITMGDIGVPLFMSAPHFLFGDQKYLKDVIGLSPNFSIHHTAVYYEPLTGLIMKANKRAQFNSQLYRDPRITIMKNLPEIMFPMMWLDENFNIDQANADIFYSQVKLPLEIITIGKYAILGVGCVVLSICLIKTISMWRKNRKNDHQSSVMIN